MRDDTALHDISVIQKTGNSFDNDLPPPNEAPSRVIDDTVINIEVGEGVCFGMWVSFIEIYNEAIHDLLDMEPIGRTKKRTTLRLGEDKNGNPYVKGVTEVR